jgi:hypothetical protein
MVDAIRIIQNKKKIMKIKINKRITIMLSLVIMMIGLNSCIKEHVAKETVFSNLQDHVDIVQSGLTNFSTSSIGFNNGDTNAVTLIINLASVNLPSAPVNVTIGVDPTQIDAYNAANGTSYVLLPTNLYSIGSTKLTIPAGQQFAQTTVSFYKDSTLDPSVSYMLPISVTDASGKLLTGNLNTIYYHIIGNPLAGKYLQNFYRWNKTTDTTTAPNSTVFTDKPVIISPASATSLVLPESYIHTFIPGGSVTLSFSNNAGLISNFAVSLDDATQSGLTTGGFKVITAPVLVQATLVGTQATHYAGTTIRIFTVLQNSTPAIRTLIDQFVKQP